MFVVSSGWAPRISEENQKYVTCTAHDLKTPLTVIKLATTVFLAHFEAVNFKERFDGLPSWSEVRKCLLAMLDEDPSNAGASEKSAEKRARASDALHRLPSRRPCLVKSKAPRFRPSRSPTSARRGGGSKIRQPLMFLRRVNRIFELLCCLSSKTRFAAGSTSGGARH